MWEFKELGRIQKNSTIPCIASVSKDKIRWYKVMDSQISSKGMKFYSSKIYEEGELLSLNISIYSKLSEFKLLLDCIVEKRQQGSGMYYYEVDFNKIVKKHQVELDEIIKFNKSFGNYTYGGMFATYVDM